jgi:hypothetical protein
MASCVKLKKYLLCPEQSLVVAFLCIRAIFLGQEHGIEYSGREWPDVLFSPQSTTQILFFNSSLPKEREREKETKPVQSCSLSSC